MSDTLPIFERITLDIVAALETVSTVNSYQQTLNVSRVIQTPKGIEDQLVVVEELDEEEAEDGPQSHRSYTVPYAVSIFVRESRASDFNARTRLQVIKADCYKALRADKYRGGLAENTVIRPGSWFQTTESHGSVPGYLFYIDVKTRHLIDDPYTRG